MEAPPAYIEFSGFEAQNIPPRTSQSIRYPPGFVPPPPPPPVPPRPTAIPIPGHEGINPPLDRRSPNEGSMNSRYDMSSAPSTSHNSSRRPLPVAPGPVPSGIAPSSSYGSRNNTENDSFENRIANRAQTRLPTPSGPPPAFSTSPIRPTIVVSPERINAELPPTPTTTSSGSGRRRQTHRTSQQSFQSGQSPTSSHSSAFSPASFNTMDPVPWSLPLSQGIITHENTIVQEPRHRVNVNPEPGHVVSHNLFELCMNKGDVDRPPSYGKGEPVTGYVELRVMEDISEIQVTMQGNLQITYSERGMPFDQGGVLLFTSSQTLFTSAYKKGPVSTHQFTFTFPETCVASQTPLPPTWSLARQGVTAEVSYTIRAKVKRRGMFQRDGELVAKVEYYPRTAPPLLANSPLERPRPKFRMLEMEQNIHPPSGSAIVNPMSHTTFTARIRLPLPLIFASGSTIPYRVILSTPGGTHIPASLDVETSVVKISKVSLKGKPYEKRDVLSRGTNPVREAGNSHGTNEGGTFVIEGFCVAGSEGHEASWEVGGIASISYVIRFVVTPAQQVAAFAAFRDTLPTFEHSEPIILTTDNSDILLSEEEARQPARRMRHTKHRSQTGLTAVHSIELSHSNIASPISPTYERHHVRDSLRGAARITSRPPGTNELHL